MNISTKIIFAFILVTLINIGPAFVRIGATHKTQEHLNALIDSNLYEQEGISQIAYYLQRAKSNIRELLLELKNTKPNNSEINNARRVIKESITGLQENMSTLKKAAIKGREFGDLNDQQDSDVEIDEVEEIGAELHKFILGAKEFTKEEASSDDQYFLLGVFVNVVEPLSRQLQSRIDEYKRKEIRENNSDIVAISQHIVDTKNHVILASLISILATLVIGFILIRDIRKKE